MDKNEFRGVIYSHYRREGRAFPWRTNHDPWGVLVSEFMLQQTQTERVVPYWKRWMEKWPEPGDLADASLEDVLREWSGLGYNRRAKYLRECARLIVKDYSGKVPESPGELLKLPGIGPYTAGAIACFAYNYPSVFIETNIRAVIIHFYFNEQEQVADSEILPVLEEVLDREDPRTWYWALMDYGAALKKLLVNPNRKSTAYTKQSPFEGSFRQLRGALIKTLLQDGPGTAAELRQRAKMGEEDIYNVLKSLEKESMVAEAEGLYKIVE